MLRFRTRVSIFAALLAGSVALCAVYVLAPGRVEPIPDADRALVTRVPGVSVTTLEIRDRTALSRLVSFLNVEVSSGWVIAGPPCPIPRIRVDLWRGEELVRRWGVGDGFFLEHDACRTKSVPPKRIEEFLAEIGKAPEGGECRGSVLDPGLKTDPCGVPMPKALELNAWCGLECTQGDCQISIRRCGAFVLASIGRTPDRGYDVFYYDESLGTLVGAKLRVTTANATGWGEHPTAGSCSVVAEGDCRRCGRE